MVKENTRKEGKQVQRSRKVLPKKKPFSRKGVKYGDRSYVWDHFDKVTDDNGNVEKVVCMWCHEQYGPKPRRRNLKQHFRSCRKVVSFKAFTKKYMDNSSSEEEASILHSQEIQKIRDKQASSSNPCQRDGSNDGVVKLMPAAGSLGYRVACRHLSRMMASHGQGCDSSLVENINFKKFLDTIGFEVPKREDIDKMCDDYKKEATGNISSEQIRHSSRSKTAAAAGWASLAVGTVRIMEAGEVLYTACNFIDSEWKLHRVIIGAHVALPLAPDYNGPSLLGFGQRPNKEVGSLLDDQVLNTAFWRDISEHNSKPDTLVVGVFKPQEITDDGGIDRISIKDLMKQKKAQTPSKLICSAYVDDVLHTVAQCLVPEKSSPIAKQMRTNMEALERFTQKNCRQAALPYSGLDYPRSYDEQWYSLYCCLKILSGDNNDDSTLKVWGQIDKSIKEISKPSCPTSNLCLVELFDVRKVLQSELERAASSNNNDAAGAALTKARDTLDEAIKKSYLVWSIALVLDPRHRIRGLRTIFKEAYGKAEARSRISKVEKKIRELCDRVAECPCYTGMKKIVCSKERCLTEYLQGDREKCEGKDFDILKWWKNDMEGQDCKECYTRGFLGRLARDFLGMPTCSLLSSQQISQVRSIIHQQAEEAAEEEEEEVVGRKSESCSRTEKEQQQKQKKITRRGR